MTAVQAETVYSAAETADAVVLSGFCYCPACVAMAADYLVEIPAEVLAAVIQSDNNFIWIILLLACCGGSCGL